MIGLSDTGQYRIINDFNFKPEIRIDNIKGGTIRLLLRLYYATSIHLQTYCVEWASLINCKNSVEEKQ